MDDCVRKDENVQELVSKTLGGVRWGYLVSVDKSSDRVRQMFGEIAGRYDFLNRLLSLGIDVGGVTDGEGCAAAGNAPILDVCTGTADLALAYWRAGRGATPVFGAEFSATPCLRLDAKKCHPCRSRRADYACRRRRRAIAVPPPHVSDRSVASDGAM